MEKILDPGEKLRSSWPVDGTVGYEFLNDAAALFVDPVGPTTVSRPSGTTSPATRGRSRSYAAEAKLEQASTTFTAEVERLARSFPRDDLPEALSSLPVYRTYIRDGRAVRRGSGGARRGRHRVAARRAAGVRHPLPADHAAGDGQGRRGHRLLPLRAAARAQRRRRRPRALRALDRRLPRRQRRAPAAQPARHPDPRHQALRRRAGADRRDRRHGRGVGGARARLARADLARSPGPTTPSATSSSRRWPARGRSSPSGSTATSRRRCARPSARRAGSTPTRSTRRRSRPTRAG